MKPGHFQGATSYLLEYGRTRREEAGNVERKAGRMEQEENTEGGREECDRVGRCFHRGTKGEEEEIGAPRIPPTGACLLRRRVELSRS